VCLCFFLKCGLLPLYLKREDLQWGPSPAEEIERPKGNREGVGAKAQRPLARETTISKDSRLEGAKA
jgi:hypothetical protein